MRSINPPDRSVLNPLLVVVLQDASDISGQLGTIDVFMKFIHVVQQQDLHNNNNNNIQESSPHPSHLISFKLTSSELN